MEDGKLARRKVEVLALQGNYAIIKKASEEGKTLSELQSELHSQGFTEGQIKDELEKEPVEQFK